MQVVAVEPPEARLMQMLLLTFQMSFTHPLLVPPSHCDIGGRTWDEESSPASSNGSSDKENTATTGSGSTSSSRRAWWRVCVTLTQLEHQVSFDQTSIFSDGREVCGHHQHAAPIHVRGKVENSLTTGAMLHHTKAQQFIHIICII